MAAKVSSSSRNPGSAEFLKEERVALLDEEVVSPKNLPNRRSDGAAGNGTFASSVFLLFNSGVGTGILTLPYCFHVAGIIPGTIAIFFFAFMTGLSSIGIVVCCAAVDASDYQTVVRKLLGPKASYVMSAILAPYCLMSSISRLIIVADIVGPVLIHFVGKQDAWWMQRETHILAGGLVAFPLMCLREITSLRFTAFLSLAAITFIVCCVVQQVGSEPSAEEYGELEYFVPSWSMCLALPSLCLSFQNQIQVPAIYGELRQSIKTVRRMSCAIVFAICFIQVPMYLLTALSGYYMFRAATPPDVLEGPYDQSATSIFIARCMLALVAILGIPVNHFSSRSASYTLWEGLSRKQSADVVKTEPAACFFRVEVVTYFILMTVLAMLLKGLDVAFDIMAATGGMAIIFFMPGSFILKGQRTSKFTLGWLVLARALIAIGAVMVVVSVGDVIYQVS